MLLALICAALAACAGAVIGTAIVGWAGWLLFALAVAGSACSPGARSPRTHPSSVACSTATARPTA